MEPALDGRDDLTVLARNELAGSGPQWSPPLTGGMTVRTMCELAGHTETPQWSPPLTGGMTGEPQPARERRHLAAMEPALDGRDDWGANVANTPNTLPQWSPPLTGGMTGRADRRAPHEIRAAMEPALDGRDDMYTSTTGFGGFVAPQWSPPLTGGMTLVPAVGEMSMMQPQWSPPLTGGMTAREKRAS